MSLIKSNNVGSSGGAPFYNDVATTSVRLEAVAKKSLNRTITTGSRRLFTYSFWFKQTELGTKFFLSKGENVSNADISQISMDGSDRLFIKDIVDDSITFHLVTTRLFRDTSSWYNVVIAFDTAQSTAANRIKIYINGVQETSFATEDYPQQNYDALFTFNQSSSSVLHIGAYSADTNDAGEHWGGYFSDITHIDGAALAPTSFGEAKNGVWIPIDTSGLTFGDEGFLLKFDQVGLGTADTDTIGADTSNNDNHFTSVNIAASDCAMLDSPENNFCTLNPLANHNFGSAHSAVHTEGSLKAIASGTAASHLYGTFKINDFLTNGCYFEARILRIDTSRFYFGAIDPISYTGVEVASYQNTQKAVMNHLNRIFSNLVSDGNSTFNPNSMAGGEAIKNNDIVGVAIKGDNVWFHVNGVYTKDASNTVGNPSSGANPAIPAITAIATTDYFPYFGYASDYHVNFGQDPGFGGFLTGNNVGTETADEGAGLFKYDVPTGFQAMCSANLVEPDIGANSGTQATDHFNPHIYGGTDAATRTFDIGFVSDWSWFKARNQNNYGSQLYDSSRGETKVIVSSADTAEATNAAGVTDFDDSGNLLKIGTDAFLNESGTTMVIWNWKANGSTTSTVTDGTINSTVQTNETAGFSIVTWTGDGEDQATIGHGLGVKPSWIIAKSRNVAGNWRVWHQSLSSEKFMTLDQNVVPGTSDSVWGTSPAQGTATFSIGSNTDVNQDTKLYVAYVFREITGYSKFGSYVGNADTNGPFVFTGFRPAWIMIKRFDTTGSWLIYDNARNPDNMVTQYTFADITNAEGSDGKVDFLSNGFKQRSPSSYTDDNASGGTYLYMAFADSAGSFKYANAR